MTLEIIQRCEYRKSVGYLSLLTPDKGWCYPSFWFEKVIPKVYKMNFWAMNPSDSRNFGMLLYEGVFENLRHQILVLNNEQKAG